MRRISSESLLYLCLALTSRVYYDIQFIRADVCSKHNNSIIPTILASHDFYSYLCELYECGRA